MKCQCVKYECRIPLKTMKTDMTSSLASYLAKKNIKYKIDTYLFLKGFGETFILAENRFFFCVCQARHCQRKRSCFWKYQLTETTSTFIQITFIST